MDNKSKFRDSFNVEQMQDETDYDEFQNVEEKLKTALQDVISDPSNSEKLAHLSALKKIRDGVRKFRKEAKETGASDVQETYAYRIPKAYPEAVVGSSSKFGGLRGVLETTKNKLFPSKVKTQKTVITREEIPEAERTTDRAPSSIKQPKQEGIDFEDFLNLPEEAQQELRETHLYDEKTQSYLPRDVVLGKKK